VGAPADGPGLGAAGVVDSDPLGAGEIVDVGEWVGVRDGLGDSVGLGTYRVGLDVGADVPPGWVAPAGTGTGRTRI
jgi:hypothetical protein